LILQKKNIKDKKRKWLVLLIVIFEITIFLTITYRGFKYFFQGN